MGYREISEDRILTFSATPGFKEWEPFFTDESVIHPAKMNLRLLLWILEAYTKPGDVILDPMAGTGSTVIMASLLGRHGIAVELEPRFCDMIRANIGRSERQATLIPKGGMICIQGDARELSKLLSEVNAIITSPPYGNRLSDVAIQDGDPTRMGYRQAVDMVLTSPPFGKSQTGGGIFRKGYKAPGEDEVSDPSLPLRHGRPLSDDPANIDNMQYGNINAIVTSPPYEGSVDAKGDPVRRAERMKEAGLDPKTIVGGKARCGEIDWRYSEDSGNIGNLKSETYLQAMLQVYSECHKVLKDEGIMIVVTKNFIRNKKVIRLDLDTIKLCEAAGFTLRDRWYFKLPTRSFWRILYHKKYPEVPEVEFEDVLVFIGGKNES